MKFLRYSLVVVLLINLSGCATPTPIHTPFPDIPKELAELCPTELKTVETKSSDVPITTLIETNIINYNTYHVCASKVKGWNEWYIKVKNAYDRIINGSTNN